MDSLGEILHLCRLCLVKDHVNIPIFDDPGNIRQIPLKISSCLPVQISRNDNLPKKICDGCSEKLDLCYEFWNSSAIAEKKLLSMVAEKKNQIVEPPVPQPILMKAELVPMDNITSEQVAEEENQSEPLVPQPIVVKQEAEVLDTFESSVERTEETEAPPSKRPRRSAAIKAQKNIVPESDDDDDDEGAATEDINSEEPLTKEEPYVDEDIHTEVPDMSVDDAQPGTSGLNQGMEDSTTNIQLDKGEVNLNNLIPKVKQLYCNKCGKLFEDFEKLHAHIFQNPDLNHKFRCVCCGYIVGESMVHLFNHLDIFCSTDSYQSVEIQEYSPGTARYYCEICGEGIELLSDFQEHHKISHQDIKVCCSVCPIEKASFVGIFNHFREHVVYKNVKLKCSDCSLVYENSQVYKTHCSAVHGRTAFIPFDCALCPRVFMDDEDKFLSHVQSHCRIVKSIGKDQLNVAQRTCQYCAKVFSHPTSCWDHLATRHKTIYDNVKYSCSFCRQWVHPLDMDRHMSFHTSRRAKQVLINPIHNEAQIILSKPTPTNPSKVYKCNLCKVIYKSMLLLNKHMKCHMPGRLLHNAKGESKEGNQEMQYLDPADLPSLF